MIFHNHNYDFYFDNYEISVLLRLLFYHLK